MKKVAITGLFIALTSAVFGQVKNVSSSNLRPVFNSLNDVYEVRYDILDYSNDDLYLIEFYYYDDDVGQKVKPKIWCVSGDGGKYAVRGGVDKVLYWDLYKQGVKLLGRGFFSFDIITISREASKRLNRVYKKQYKIRNKLERDGMKTNKIRRLRKKMNRLDKRIRKNQ